MSSCKLPSTQCIFSLPSSFSFDLSAGLSLLQVSFRGKTPVVVVVVVVHLEYFGDFSSQVYFLHKGTTNE